MFTDTDLVENTQSTSLLVDATDDSRIFKYPYGDIAPLTRDTDGICMPECDSGNWYAHVKQENLPVVKQEPQDVCCTGSFLCRSRS